MNPNGTPQAQWTLFANLGYILREMWHQHKSIYAILALYTVFRGIFSYAVLYIPKYIMDNLLGYSSPYDLPLLFVLFALAGLCRFEASVLYNRGYARLIQIRVALIAYHQSVCLRTAYENTESAVYEDQVYASYRAVANNGTGIEGIMHRIFEWPGYFVSAVICCTALIRISALLFMAVISCGAVCYYVKHRASIKKDESNPLSTKLNRQSQELTYVMTNQKTAKEVRTYTIADMLLRKSSEVKEKALQLQVKQLNIGINSGFFTDSIGYVSNALIYAYLIIQTFVGNISISYMTLILGAVADLTSVVDKVLSDYVFARDQNYNISLFRDFISDTTCHADSSGKTIDSIESIRFDNVSYRYHNAEDDALRNISFELRRGTRTAIVGPNGAGKTTFVKLLVGLYTPTEGCIYVNGIDLRNVSKEGYYRLLAALFQDFHIMAYTIAENIALTETGFDTDRMMQILSDVNLKSRFAQLAEGIHTPASKTVELNGTDLSGGEKQRLALARALYKQADAFVLDEPSASLDPIEENRLYSMFSKLTKDKLTVFVSHRLASTRFCDTILLFSGGELCECGTHDELIAHDGEYAKMYRAQAQFYVDAD